MIENCSSCPRPSDRTLGVRNIRFNKTFSMLILLGIYTSLDPWPVSVNLPPPLHQVCLTSFWKVVYIVNWFDFCTAQLWSLESLCGSLCVKFRCLRLFLQAFPHPSLNERSPGPCSLLCLCLWTFAQIRPPAWAPFLPTCTQLKCCLHPLTPVFSALCPGYSRPCRLSQPFSLGCGISVHTACRRSAWEAWSGTTTLLPQKCF